MQMIVVKVQCRHLSLYQLLCSIVREGRVAFRWLSDPINSQGVNKQLTAAKAAMGGGRKGRRGTVFLTRCPPFVAAWVAGKAALGGGEELERSDDDDAEKLRMLPLYAHFRNG